MTESDSLSPDRLDRLNRRSLLATLFVVLVLGATALGLILGLAPVRGNLGWWLLPVGLAAAVTLPLSRLGRRWRRDPAAVAIHERDEWRLACLARATRVTLIVVLAVQWPLGLVLGSLGRLPPPRGAMGMAAATITLGLGLLIALFLWFDRE